MYVAVKIGSISERAWDLSFSLVMFRHRPNRTRRFELCCFDLKVPNFFEKFGQCLNVCVGLERW